MQSRDEIAEQVVALAGSVSNEKAARMRELVGEARREGLDVLHAAIQHTNERLAQLTARVFTLEMGARLQNTVEGAQDRKAARPASTGEMASSTASPASVPLKVAPSFGTKGDYGVWCGISGIATFHGPDAKANAEAFAASRAPHPSPFVPPDWLDEYDALANRILADGADAGAAERMDEIRREKFDELRAALAAPQPEREDLDNRIRRHVCEQTDERLAQNSRAYGVLEGDNRHAHEQIRVEIRACEKRLDALERGRLSAPFGKIPEHAFSAPSGSTPKSAHTADTHCTEPLTDGAENQHAARASQGEPLSCPHCSKPLPPYSLIREREAQGEPPTIDRCLTVFGLAYNEAKAGASPMATDTEAWCERQGIAAVRSLCLAHIPDAYLAVQASWQALDTIMVQHGLDKKATSDEAQAWLRERLAPSSLLAEIVDAGDDLRAYFDHGTLTMRSTPDEENPGDRDWVLTHEYVDGARRFLDAWDLARAALPKGGAQ